jgi:hypothetical protein
MLERQKLQRDIDTLLESIQRDYADLDRLDPTSAEHGAVRRRLEWLNKELADLLARLNSSAPTR